MDAISRSLLLSWALLSCAGSHHADTICPPPVPPPMAVITPLVPTAAGPVLPPPDPPVRHHRHRSCMVREVDGSVVDEVEEDLEPADINPLLDRAVVVVDRVLEPMDASVVQRQMLDPPVETDASADPTVVFVEGGARPRQHHRRH